MHLTIVWRGIILERREGTRQGTCMNDPQIWTTVWELTVGAGWVGWAEEVKMEKVGTTVIE